MNKSILSLPVIAAALLLVVPAASRAAEESESLDSLPAPARKTAEEIVKKNKVKEVEPASEDGQKAFEVEYEKDGVEIAIVISPEGKLLCTEHRLSVGQTPDVIKKGTEEAYPGSKITSIKKVEKGGKEYYEISLHTADKKVENIKLDAKGKKMK